MNKPLIKSCMGMALFLCVSSAAGAEPPINALDRYFGYDKDISAEVPVTSDDFSLVELSLKLDKDIRRPEIARFLIDGSHRALYHYTGYKNNAHQYLVAVPNRFDGDTTISAYVDRRQAVPDTFRRDRESLTTETVVRGSNDIILLVDTSGSMRSNGRMQLAQDVVNSIGPKLDAQGNNVAVIDYDSSPEVVLGLDEPFRPLSFTAAGGTRTSNAINMAIDMLEGRSTPGKIVIDIADGRPASHTNTKAAADYITARNSEGWVVAGLGMGIDPQVYYPIRQKVTNGSVSTVLEGALARLIATAEEKVRDVNSICSGDKCSPEANDTLPPRVDFSVASQCTTAKDGDDFEFEITDPGQAGIDLNTIRLSADFGDKKFDVPYRIVNQNQVNNAVNSGVSPKRVVIRPDNVMASAPLRDRFNRANYDAAKDGGLKPFTFFVSATDMDGHKGNDRQAFDPTVVDDTRGPDVTIKTGGNDDVIRHVEDITFSARDDKVGMRPEAASFSVTYQGDRIDFDLLPSDASAPSGDACVSRHPLNYTYNADDMIGQYPEILDVMGSALETGDPLTFRARFRDHAGNVSVASRQLHFEPEIITTDEVRVPGVNHQFSRQNGLPMVSIPAVEAAFELNNSVTYYARLADQSDPGIVVNGKAITSDEVTSFDNYYLGGNVSIDLNFSSTADGVDGDSKLILLPNNAKARGIEVPIRFWLSNTSNDLKNASPLQLFERVQANVDQANSSACRVTGSLLDARGSDIIEDPACFVDWKKLPTDTYAVEQRTPEMTGFIPAPGKHGFEYDVVLYDADGTPVTMGSGKGAFDVSPAKEHLDFSLGNALDDTYRVISEVQGRLSQTGGPGCSRLTTDEDDAFNLSAINKPACLVKWKNIPDGIEMYEWTSDPRFDGTFDIYQGDATFNWSISSFSTSGEPVHLMDDSQVVPLKDTETPVITVEDENLIKDGVYWAAAEGDYIGDYNVHAVNAPLSMSLSENGKVTASDETYGGYGDMVDYRNRVMIDSKPLWTETKMEVASHYLQIPSIEGKHQFTILSVPSENIRPEVEVGETTVLNTDKLSVAAQMTNPYDAETPFSKDVMGNWDIRMLSYESFRTQTPISEYKPINGAGTANFDIDLSELELEYLRLIPEARLKSPIKEYERTVMGSRPIYITVLRGNAIESSINARRLVGEAPLTVMARIDYDSILDRRAVGDVKWEIRKKGSGSWEVLPENERAPDRLTRSFERGEYDLRARVFNRHSGAEFVTETMKVHAYQVPYMSIEGPYNAFVGDEVTLTAKGRLATQYGPEVPANQMVFEWSEDGGETWVEGDETRKVSSDEVTRINVAVRARMFDAPEDDEDAVDEANSRVSFREIKIPRARILGDRVIESGRTVEWRGLSRTPYSNMDVDLEGRFILPNGDIVNGHSIEYLPTAEDVAQERFEITYEVWVKGFKEAGAHAITSNSIRVWTYDWPAWEFYTRLTTYQAPSELTLRIRSPNSRARYIEGLTFDWTVPDGVIIEDARREDGRSLRFEKPGTYTIKAEITDDRNYSTTLSYPITIDPPDPWEIGFRMSKSSEENRAPLELRMVPDIDGGHPRDRINNYRYYLNGQLLLEGRRYISMELDEGTHEIALEIESELGNGARYTETMEVLPNQPPSCEIESRERGAGWRFSAECTDPDGYIEDHLWIVNGEEIAVSGSRISVVDPGSNGIKVSLQAFDNGGKASNIVNWRRAPGGGKTPPGLQKN